MTDRRSLFDKLWESHVISHLSGGNDLLAIDRIYLHDLCGTFAFQCLDSSGHRVASPERVYATPDHTLASKPCRTDAGSEMSALIMPAFRKGCKKYGVTLYDIGDPRQGIVHITGPDCGLSLPGMTIACGDSHTCTHGALGTLAMGVGTNQVYHALATSCLIAKRPKTMEICLEGICRNDIDAMDIILYILSVYGNTFGAGYAIEYTGSAIRNMPVEERFTICNLTIESGAEYCLISPDANTLEYLKGREHAPGKEDWGSFAAYCEQIATTAQSVFDRKLVVDVGRIERQISWGVNPAHTIAVTDTIPDADHDVSESAAESYRKAYEYMNLQPGTAIRGTKIDQVFIGSCANGCLSTIRKVAEVAAGKKVRPGIRAQIVPGSERVKREAERLGLDRVLIEAGFIWGEPCCSLCVGSNGETVEAGKRCVSTTNRNFIGRQGRGARTHIASARTAALAALTGEIG